MNDDLLERQLRNEAQQFTCQPNDEGMLKVLSKLSQKPLPTKASPQLIVAKIAGIAALVMVCVLASLHITESGTTATSIESQTELAIQEINYLRQDTQDIMELLSFAFEDGESVLE